MSDSEDETLVEEAGPSLKDKVKQKPLAAKLHSTTKKKKTMSDAGIKTISKKEKLMSSGLSEDRKGVKKLKAKRRQKLEMPELHEEEKMVKAEPKIKQEQKNDLRRDAQKANTSIQYHSIEREKNKKSRKTKKASPQFNQTSIKTKIALSLLWMLINVVFFPYKPINKNHLMKVEDQPTKPMMDLVTDEKTRWITVKIQNTQKIWDSLPFQSTKYGSFKAKVKYTLGYRFERFEDDSGQFDILLSPLSVLDYNVEQIKTVERTNGYFNSWQMEDVEEVKEYIKEEHIQRFKEQVLEKVTTQRRQLYLGKVESALSVLIQQNENMFQWMLKRIDGFMSGALQPLISDTKVNFQDPKEQQIFKNHWDSK